MHAPTSQADGKKPTRGHRGFRAWAGLLLILLPVLQALNLALVRSPDTRKFYSNLFQALAAIVVAAATIRAARELRRENSESARGWSTIAVAMCFWAVGMALFMFIEVVLKLRPYPGVPDFFFLLFYPAMILGLWRLPREPVSRRELWNNALDVAAMAVVGGLVIWQFNLRLILGGLGVERNAGTWASLGYTFVDTLLLLMIFFKLVRKLGQGRQFVPMLLLVIGCFFQISADLFQGYVTTKTDFTSGSPIDLGWVLFSTFAGFAALDLLKRGEEAAPDGPTGARLEVFRTAWTLAVTYLWIAMVVVLLIWAVFHRADVHAGVLVVGVLAAAILAITRQVRTLRENAGLYFGLQQAAAELETKVQERTAELERQRTLLAESERRTRAIFDLSFGFIGLLDLKGTLLDASQSALQFAGVALSDVVGRPFWDTPWWRHSPEMRERLRAAVQAATSGEVVRFEATNAGTGGVIRTVDFSLKPVLGEGGKIVLLIPEGRDITEQKQAEEILRGSEERAQRQREAIARLVLNEAVASASLPEALHCVTEALTGTLAVERASVWRLADDAPELHCLSLFEAGRRVHSGGVVLKTADFPRYIEAVRAESRIAAHDAQADPRTHELADGYLVPLGITSMLDAGIQIEGRLAGVVCLEHIGSPRRWYPDEEAFVSTAAALVAQIFANAKRYQAEVALRQSEDRYRKIAQCSPDLVWITDLSGQYTYASPVVERMYGWTVDEVLKLSTRDTSTPQQTIKDAAMVEEGLARVAAGNYDRNRVRTFESEERRKDGSTFWAEVSASFLWSDDGKLVGIIGVTRDISERKKIEESLARRAAFDALIARILAGFASCAPEEVDSRIRGCLEEMARFVGVDSAIVALFSPDQATWSMAYSWAAPEIPDVSPRYQGIPMGPSNWAAMKLLAGEAVVINCMADIPPDAASERRVFEQDGIKSRLALPLRGRGGRVTGAIGFRSYSRQVTWILEDFNQLRVVSEAIANALERRQAAAALNESERRFRDLFERSPDAVFVEDQQGVIVDANPAACQLHGLLRDQLVGKNVLETVPPEQQEMVRREFPKWLAGELTQAEGISLTADGERVPVEIRGALIRYGNRPALLLHVRDITERKQAEARIRQQAALLEATHDAILVWDLAQGVQYMNPAAEELTGKRFAEARSQGLNALLRPKAALALEAAIRAVESRGEWNGELTLLSGEDKSRVIASRWTVLADVQGKPTAVLITCNDVTERKQLESQYLRAQRLESVGTLASGVAHDLNNILSPVLMGVELLSMQAADEDTRGILTMMKDSARRGVDTVKQLLTFARGTDAQKGPVQPRHLLKEIARLLQQTFPKSIQIYTDYIGRPATVLADPSQLHQVLMNLCVNARDAMPDGGVLYITLENQMLDDAGARIHPKARPGPYVVFKVSDSGTGIPPEILDRIFDPFFTTKPQGKGTGLGLATVLGIVENHGGFVSVESKPGQGTTFQVFLPASASTDDLRGAPGEALDVPRGQGELVLVVDDEAAILHLAGEILRHGGYSTLTASNASEALHLYERNHDRIRAVLTDIMMPFGDGRQLMAMLYAQDPKLPILAMSGLATSEFQRETLKRGARAFIRKPFAAEELLQVLADVLGLNPS